MAQTWNNILGYIKRKLGTNLNLLEFTDDEIIEGIREDVIPEFSQYNPCQKCVIITPTNCIGSKTTGNQWTYRLPLPVNEYVIGIYDIYSISSSSYGNDDPFFGTKYSESQIQGSILRYGDGSMNIVGGGVIDAVIDNTFLDMLSYLGTRQTWDFKPPNTIMFDLAITNAIVIYNTIHKQLNTIMPDLYNFLFKKMCLQAVYEWVLAIRTKYESISTPMGEIKLNWARLEQESTELKNEIRELKDNIPFDQFVHISN